MVDVVEHVYPWQLREIVKNLQEVMRPSGVVFISTPNRLYEDYFYRWKRISEFPFTFMKMGLRVLRGKIKPGEFWAKAFKFSLQRDSIDLMHVNVMSPAELKNYFPGWHVQLKCDDPSRNLLSLIVGRWLGREIVACAALNPGRAV